MDAAQAILRFDRFAFLHPIVINHDTLHDIIIGKARVDPVAHAEVSFRIIEKIIYRNIILA